MGVVFRARDTMLGRDVGQILRTWDTWKSN